ncbi:unnamed protein product, partial [Effrenium voratum]
ALERAARKREREEAEAGEPDAAAVEKVTRQRRMKQVDITEDDAPVMKTMAKFPMHRRIAVLHLDDGDAGMHRCIANGDPFILRPKKGKSFLKSASDWKAAESGLNSLVQGFAAKFEEHRELSRDKGQPVQRTSLPCPSDDDAISTL